MEKPFTFRGALGRIPGKRPQYTLHEIKRWREDQFDAGLPCGLEDYFAAHSICAECSGYGVKMIGWSPPMDSSERQAAENEGMTELPVYAACPVCGGSGESSRPQQTC